MPRIRRINVAAADRRGLNIIAADRGQLVVTVGDRGIKQERPPRILVPNMLYWPIVETTTVGPAYTPQKDMLVKIYEQYLAFGANSLPLYKHHSSIIAPVDDRTDYDFLDNALQAQEEVGGYPIQMAVQFGYHHNWEGSQLAPTIYRRAGTEMFDADHLIVYHTNVATVAGETDGGLEALVDANRNDVSHKLAVLDIHCPGYRGDKYQAAIAKLKEAVKWYSNVTPVCSVHFDNEFYMSSNRGDYYTEMIIGLTPTQNAPWDGLEGCTRCLSSQGFIDHTDDIGRDLLAAVREYAPEALVAQWHVYLRGSDPGTDPAVAAALLERRYMYYWAFGATTGFTTPMYSLYDVTYDKDTEVGDRTLFYDPVARYEWMFAQGPTYHAFLWSGAPVGACIYLSQRMDVEDWTQGYMTPQMMYDICYHLATKGVTRFALWPGYSGKDKDPVNYVPGGGRYSEANVADDAAALLVMPAMHDAVADYRRT